MNADVSFDTFVVYTTSVGGMMTVAWSTREKYDEAVRTGKWRVNVDHDASPEYVDLAMVAIASVDELHDFAAPERVAA